jgi:hypothetical protein
MEGGGKAEWEINEYHFLNFLWGLFKRSKEKIYSEIAPNAFLTPVFQMRHLNQDIHDLT